VIEAQENRGQTTISGHRQPIDRNRGLSLIFLLAMVAVSFPSPAFDLQGHRGARGLAPENTLPAFAAALALGVTTLELDVGVTRDGVVVVHHDTTLNPDITRGPDGRWLEARGPSISSLTYKDLIQYDVGRLRPDTKYAAAFPEQKPADGTRIPRLADVFAVVRRARNDSVRFNIETKLSPLAPAETLPPEPFARVLIEEIRFAGMTDRATIQSFDWRTLQVVQREAPEIATVYLTSPRTLAPVEGKPSPWLAGIDPAAHGGSVPKMVKAAGGAIWSPNVGFLDAQKMAEARSLGVKVVVWTVNEPEQIRRMLDLGVDGIISDRPDLVRAEMAARGMALPKPSPMPQQGIRPRRSRATPGKPPRLWGRAARFRGRLRRSARRDRARRCGRRGPRPSACRARPRSSRCRARGGSAGCGAPDPRARRG
jgi:glycerophosphoryl diester phosphodiesterase